MPTKKKMAAESQAAKTFQNYLEGAVERYQTIKAEFLEKSTEGSVAYMVEWHLSELIEAEVLAALATEYMPPEDEDDDFDYTWDHAVDHFVKSMERKLEHIRGESGSTSGSTRLVEQIQMARKTQIYASLVQAQRKS